jgi:hypothetical protein
MHDYLWAQADRDYPNNFFANLAAKLAANLVFADDLRQAGDNSIADRIGAIALSNAYTFGLTVSAPFYSAIAVAHNNATAPWSEVFHTFPQR